MQQVTAVVVIEVSCARGTSSSTWRDQSAMVGVAER
jgi:hypothetical protein